MNITPLLTSYPYQSISTAMEHVEEIQSAAHAAAARASEMVVEFSEHLRAHPAVQSAIEHPIFQHEIFQHPVLQQLLNDPRALAILTGIIVILVVFACELSNSEEGVNC